jgi:Na+/H+ antiporter NhaD/arsenite permease-like protein
MVLNSNVPAVMLLKSLVPRFADPHTAWLILAMASTLSENLTITGAEIRGQFGDRKL